MWVRMLFILSPISSTHDLGRGAPLDKLGDRSISLPPSGSPADQIDCIDAAAATMRFCGIIPDPARTPLALGLAASMSAVAVMYR